MTKTSLFGNSVCNTNSPDDENFFIWKHSLQYEQSRWRKPLYLETLFAIRTGPMTKTSLFGNSVCNTNSPDDENLFIWKHSLQYEQSRFRKLLYLETLFAIRTVPMAKTSLFGNSLCNTNSPDDENFFIWKHSLQYEQSRWRKPLYLETLFAIRTGPMTKTSLFGNSVCNTNSPDDENLFIWKHSLQYEQSRWRKPLYLETMFAIRTVPLTKTSLFGTSVCNTDSPYDENFFIWKHSLQYEQSRWRKPLYLETMFAIRTVPMTKTSSFRNYVCNTDSPADENQIGR